MDDEEKQLFDRYLKKPQGQDAVDRMFLAQAKRALLKLGHGALEYLALNLRVPKTTLVLKLGKGASGLGLAMAIYEEAAEKGVVREVAKDLLSRKINEEFPDGWFSKDDVGPLVKLGFWEDEIRFYAHSTTAADAARQILKSLAIDNPPPEGWKPDWENDPLIDQLFDRYWPVEELP